MSITVETTVTVNGQTKTFTATAETTGNDARAARGLARAVADDAANWTYETEKAAIR
jgi:hypothetical protein